MARRAASMPLKITVDSRDLHKLHDTALYREASARIAEAGIEIVEPLARKEAPKRTGKSAATITGTIETIKGVPTGIIKPGKKGFAIRILASGRKQSTIAPRNRRRGRGRPKKGERKSRPALLIPSRGGGAFFRYAVNIPALAPDPWPERAARAGEPPFKERVEDILDEMYKRI